MAIYIRTRPTTGTYALGCLGYLAVVGHEVVVMGCWGQRDLGCQDGWC